jgi:hypothetical protein
MTIGFSKAWFYHSISAGIDSKLSRDDEKAIIIKMILNSDSEKVKLYANDEANKLDVYVRTGIHISDSDPDLHVQAILGSTDETKWTKGDVELTVHIAYHEDADKAYKTKEYTNAPKNSGQKKVVNKPKGNFQGWKK